MLQVLLTICVSFSDETRQLILTYQRGEAFGHLISMAAGNTASDICYNCAGVLGQLAIGGELETSNTALAEYPRTLKYQ